jgi:hypothetical protein
MQVQLNQIGNIESFYMNFREDYQEDNSLPETHSCELCEENDALIEVIYPKTDKVPYSRSELICIACYAHPDYQVIIKRDKPIIKLI